jgi:hypothetical protein
MEDNGALPDAVGHKRRITKDCADWESALSALTHTRNYVCGSTRITKDDRQSVALPDSKPRRDLMRHVFIIGILAAGASIAGFGFYSQTGNPPP